MGQLWVEGYIFHGDLGVFGSSMLCESSFSSGFLCTPSISDIIHMFQFASQVRCWYLCQGCADSLSFANSHQGVNPGVLVHTNVEPILILILQMFEAITIPPMSVLRRQTLGETRKPGIKIGTNWWDKVGMHFSPGQSGQIFILTTRTHGFIHPSVTRKFSALQMKYSQMHSLLQLLLVMLSSRKSCCCLGCFPMSPRPR